MINKIFSLMSVLFILAAVLMIPGTLMAGGDASGESSQAVSAENSVEGTLTAMESYGHILIRPEAGNLARLRVRPDAVITRNGKPAKISDLHAGDKVRAKYDSNNWASELHATGT